VALMATTVSATAGAQDLNVFEAGSDAVAAEVNENFELLESRIEALEAQLGQELTMQSLSGSYVLHLQGARHEYFSNDDSGDTVQEIALRNSLLSTELVLHDGGNMELVTPADSEFDIMTRISAHGDLEREGGLFGDENPTGTWELDGSVISVCVACPDGFEFDLQVSRQGEVLLGSLMLEEPYEYVSEYDEYYREDEWLIFHAIRLPE